MKKEHPLRPKVGHIQFLNCLPLYYGLVKSHAMLDIELIKGTPTELNRMLISGNLDVSPVSSIEYARHSDSLMLFPDFTVSSDGEVKSILLLSRLPVEKLSGRVVALATTSATSQVLLKLILSRRYGIEPEYVSCEPEPDKMFAIADAGLLIGDIALEYHLHRKDFYSYDLGIEWKQLTGKKMVYAVWAVNRNFSRTRSKLCENVFETFRRSMDYSLRHLDEIVKYAAKWEPFGHSFLSDYFRCLRFDFGRDYQEGLLQFYDMAKEIGEIEKVPDLEFIDLHSGVNT